MTKRQKYLKKYKKENKAKIKAYEAERYLRDRDRILAHNIAWNRANKERIAEISKKWDKENKERRRANGLRWQKENPEKVKVIFNNRRARKAKAGGSFTAEEWIVLCKKYNYRCVCCGKRKKLEADHVIPIVKGGTSNIDNIQPLCRSCNAKKSAKIIDYRPKAKGAGA